MVFIIELQGEMHPRLFCVVGLKRHDSTSSLCGKCSSVLGADWRLIHEAEAAGNSRPMRGAGTHIAVDAEALSFMTYS